MPEVQLIPIDALEDDFNHFLNIDSNKRIFFTGKYGIGKTYFLKKFFASRKDTYEVFHLSPADYQISHNENIIELLKYDLLIELLQKKEDIFEENTIDGVKESALLFYSWLKDKYSVNDILQTTIDGVAQGLSLIPNPASKILSKLGKPLKDLLILDKEFQAFKKDYLSDEKGIVQKYIDEISRKNISEPDYLSFLIAQKIKKLKDSKRSILVLDDLDRIDPEHIFRILNIFSAHFNDEGNKFGFDSVLIVGDVKNIKSIFYHKYGKDTDFDGYLNKFYTIKPYSLDNRGIISKVLPELLKSIKFEEIELASAIGDNGYIKLLLSDILSRALRMNKFTIRQLYKPLNFNFPELKKNVYAKDPFKDSFEQVFDIGIKLMVAMFGGDKEYFTEIITEIKSRINPQDKGTSAPYTAYARSMVNRLNIVTPGTKTSWKDFYITVPADGQTRYLEVDGPPVNQTKVFYELLVNYLKEDLYIKNTEWDYER